MSNVIKSNYIRYKPGNKMTLDYKERDNELQARRISKLALSQAEEGFQGGLEAVMVDPIATEEDQRKKAETIVENAKRESAQIIELAKVEAERLQEDTKKLAKKQGYEEGIIKGETEIQKIKNDLSVLQKQQQEEYRQILSGIEGQVTELMVSLITKLTGILIEDKSEIILHLVEKTLEGEDTEEDYKIRVSSEDLEFLTSKKDYIEDIVGREVQIVVNPQLTKNQCLIETEGKIIDCSLDVQLNNLITDLKLLSSI